MSDWWRDSIHFVSNPDGWPVWSIITIRILIIFILSRIVIRILRKAVRHFAADKDKFRFNPRRSATIIKLMGNVISYVINFVMVLMILGELGVQYGPMLAGAGVFGLAIGFGAQSLVKDVITGFFIIFEDQFAVGDVVQIGAYKGTVEEIGLRITRVKSWTGEQHIIPNGSIIQVTNYSVHHSLAVVDVPLAYETNIDRAIEVIKETAVRVREENPDIMKDPEVLGVQSLSRTEIMIRVICECKPNTQGGVTRKLQAEIKSSLDRMEA